MTRYCPFGVLQSDQRQKSSKEILKRDRGKSRDSLVIESPYCTLEKYNTAPGTETYHLIRPDTRLNLPDMSLLQH